MSEIGEYEADVIETLESTFGEIENKSSLAEAIMGAARNAAEDNIDVYTRQTVVLSITVTLRALSM